jgi:hypothetical protein
LLFALFFSINLVVFGQNDDITYHQAPNTAKNEPKKKANTEYLERISIGGTGGLQIGNFTYIELSPNAAYHFNNMFCAGIGGTYIFYQEKFYSYTYTDHIYGPRAFAEGHFFNFLGLHAAYQGLNYKRALPTIEKPRIWSNNLCVGGGYYQRTGRFAMYVYLLWNFSDRSPEENIYKNPLLFKAGFDFFLR